MPAHAGPNILGESNLVFAYDTGDASNSYIGEPTVNVATNAPTRDGWPGSYTLVDSNTKTFNLTTTTIPWGGGDSWCMFHYDVTAYIGSNITISGTFEVIDQSTGQFSWLMLGQPIVGQTYLGYSSEVDRLYKATSTKEKISWSGIANGSGKVGLTMWMTNGASGYLTVRLSNVQVEVKSHVTPFVNGTRSATQGLLPVIGNSTIDLTNVSFDSSAKMVFDGTDDYISIPTYTFGNGNWTLNMLINANDFANFNLMSNTSGGPVTNAFGAYSSKIFYYNYDGSWQSHSGNTTLSTGTWYMLTWVNYAGATANLGTMQMFVNGIADSSVFNSYTTNGGPCNAIGANWYPSSFNGKIDVVQIYNKSLTAQEIKQNYQQYKTRFNLS